MDLQAFSQHDHNRETNGSVNETIRDESGVISMADNRRIESCIWGQAVGDAIGLGCEFKTREQIKENYKSTRFTYDDIVQDRHTSQWMKGDWTDDTDQMLLVMKTIMNTEPALYATTFASLLWDWWEHGIAELGDNGGVGLGRPVLWVMNEECFLDDPKKAARIVWNVADYTENGSIMKVGVIGTMNTTIDYIVETTTEFCLICHSDPRCVASCVFLVVCIHYFSRKNYPISISEVIERAKLQALRSMRKLDNFTKYYEERFLNYFKPINDIADLILDRPQVRSTIKQTFRCVVYALQELQKGRGFDSILWDVILQGGDSDTNGCVVGTMLGAYFGKVPKAYIVGLTYGDYMRNRISEWIAFVNS